MSKIRRSWIGALLALALITLGVAPALRAQNASSPLVLLVSGDYYLWDGSAAPKQLTNWGFNQDPSLSPDGTQIAYMSYAQITADAITRSGGVGGGEFPGNIWTLTPATANAERVADQPVDASYFIQNVPDKATVRSRPVWSPGGDKLAWTEFTLPNTQTNQIVVYDIATRAASTLVAETPAQAGVPVPADLVWTSDGLMMRSTTMDATTQAFVDSFLVYDAQGNLLRTIPTSTDNLRTLVSYLPVLYGPRSYLAALYSTGQWELIDPRDGTSQPAIAPPELYSPNAVNGIVASSLVNDDHSLSIQLRDVDGAALGGPMNIGFSFDHVALSPDGMSAAFILYNPAVSSAEDTVTVWHGGELTRVPTVSDTAYLSAFTWGVGAWRIPNAPVQQPQTEATSAATAEATVAATDNPGITPVAGTPTPEATVKATPFSCPGAPAPRLTLGGEGRVIDTNAANNLRENPSLQGEITAVIPPRGEFIVTTGPECHDNIVWWAVDFGGVAGWTAENSGSDYLLEPN
jgi:hypothetical protein